MRLTTRQPGIISYAGLDKDALWAAAKRALVQADEEPPERFSSFLPIFPSELVQSMSYIGSRPDNCAPVSPQGFSIDPAEYHRAMCDEMPELYQGDNYKRNFNYDGRFVGHGVVTVDNAWATRFPQYQPFVGERLYVYMLGGGHQAVAVPESIYPRGGEMLRNMERTLRVTARCEHFISYLKRRISVGDKYDPAVFEADYLRINELLPLSIRQSELGRVMQDLCIIRGLKGEQPAQRLFTENAKRAEGIAQYAPFRCACDSFAQEPITRSTARLMQLYFEDGGYTSDLWLPYQDASEYIDRARMTLDVSVLCHGFQLAPEYDPQTRGGRYPDRVRVVIVRDRDIRPMVADTINNPAYGSGMNPLGMMNRLVYLPDSRELLRQNKLALEGVHLDCRNTDVSPTEYREMVNAAAAQELKGRLIDAMYRRESALSQIITGTRAYERAKALLDDKVAALSKSVSRLGAEPGHGQLSGYDADIDYLSRMAQNREGPPDDAEPVPFVPDSLREMSIESGYAMRNCVRLSGVSVLDVSEPELPDAPPPDSAPQAPDESSPASAPPPKADDKPQAAAPTGAPKAIDPAIAAKAVDPAAISWFSQALNPPLIGEQLRMFEPEPSAGVSQSKKGNHHGAKNRKKK